ncbi:hypothetical protein Aca07nite_85400 [Actinoplanes capillaceus]|uniref:Uncharacterized protein n=1 Tax=Actinoplanes campanulatus TaxID=113559 RepID=A0ABQ3WYA6_9ACTN|nr:hypothetical protein Aca07nite_85400 [Actinoplanes capillaceus]
MAAHVAAFVCCHLRNPGRPALRVSEEPRGVTALIGLAISERGVRDSEEAVVDLDAVHVGAALRATQ